MASATCTVTATSGPGGVVTAQVFNNINKIEYDINKQMIFLFSSNSLIYQFAMNAVATLTTTLSAGGNWTVAIS